jgi:mannitol/fructose-specific phosphotransferase system IIA component (Ntr-type)
VIPPGWLDASRVLTGLAVTSLDDLLQIVAEDLAGAAQVESARVRAAFLEAMTGEGFSIGRGVAIPHIEMAGSVETHVCLATLREPLSSLAAAPSIDGQPVDIFWFILSKPDPREHLLLLAHLARLTQSKTLLDGLRRARSPEEAVELVRVAELRHRVAPSISPRVAKEALVVVSIRGEKAVDALLIDLVDQGLGEAVVLEAQGLEEAAAREVPLFAGFRDLFGDPGGRRLFLIETPAAEADAVVALVKTVCQEYGAKEASVSVLPVETRWRLEGAAVAEQAPGGH